MIDWKNISNDRKISIEFISNSLDDKVRELFSICCNLPKNQMQHILDTDLDQPSLVYDTNTTDNRCICISYDGRLIGMVMMNSLEKYNVVRYLCVHPKFRNLYIGLYLLCFILKMYTGPNAIKNNPIVFDSKMYPTFDKYLSKWNFLNPNNEFVFNLQADINFNSILQKHQMDKLRDRILNYKVGGVVIIGLGLSYLTYRLIKTD